MKRKTLISIAVLTIMLLSCIAPTLRVFAADSNIQSVTLNSELYTAVSTYMKEKYVDSGFTYNDLLRKISGPVGTVEELDLKSSNIDDVTGLSAFSGLKKLNLSGNYLEKSDSLATTINSLGNLSWIDLSSNQIDGFSWLNSGRLEHTNLQNQKLNKAIIVQPTAENQERNYVEVEVDGMVAELGNLESVDLDVFTYRTDGKRWEGIDRSRAAETSEQVYPNTMTDGGFKYGIDYENNKIRLYGIKNIENEPLDKMYRIYIEVINSEHRYYHSEINLFYIVVNSKERGIIFKDENFYKSVKQQLTDGQTLNPDLITYEGTEKVLSKTFTSFDDLKNEIETNDFLSSIGMEVDSVTDETKTYDFEDYTVKITKGSNKYTIEASVKQGDRNLYDAAYDSALTLVIKTEDLRNKIPSLYCENEKIYDLTGLQEFIGLRKDLNISFNYVDTIERILELEENKVAEEELIRNEIAATINRITSEKNALTDETINYLQQIEDFFTAYKAYEEADKKAKEAAGSENEEGLVEAANNLKKELATKAASAKSAVKAIHSIAGTNKDLAKIWNKSYKVTTIQTPDLYELTYKDLEEIKEEEDSKNIALGYLKSELTNLQNLEKEGCLDKIVESGSPDSVSTVLAKFLLKNVANMKDKQIADFLNNEEGENSEEKLGNIAKVIKYYGNDIVQLNTNNIITILRKVKNVDNTSTSCYFDSVDKAKKAVNNVASDNYETLNDKLQAFYKLIKNLTINNKSDIINAVVKLPRLETLNMNVNNLESIDGIDNLKELKTLLVGDNLLIDINNVKWEEMSKLEKLNLGGNQLTNVDSLNSTTALPNVKELYLNDCLLTGQNLGGNCYFDIDFIKNYPKLNRVDFSGNYYSDISLLIKNYGGAKKKYGANTLAEYIRDYKKIDFYFNREKISINYGDVIENEDGTLKFNLPPIFANVEEIDPYNTTFGVVPRDGSVDEYGKIVEFVDSVNGINIGEVTIENVPYDTNNQQENTIGLGTICTIKYNCLGKNGVYNPGNSSTNTTITTNTTSTSNTSGNSANTTNTTNTTTVGSIDTVNGTKEPGTETATINDFAISSDRNSTFAYILKPNLTTSSFAARVNESQASRNISIDKINNNDNYQTDNTRVYTTESAIFSEKNNENSRGSMELVVLGDINGDGAIDSTDSSYARALKYGNGSLYSDETDELASIAFINGLKESTNFKAGDMNKNGKIDTEETRAILYYRAGLLKDFKAFIQYYQN